MKKFFLWFVCIVLLLFISVGISFKVKADASTLPSKFDLRKMGKVSNVKNQGESNSCWDFAAMDSLQSSLLPKEDFDFSENNLRNLNGFDYRDDDGGEKSMATAYFARWQGPVNEQDDPFMDKTDISLSSPLNLKAQKHVQNVYFIPSMTSGWDTEQIKKALINYGSVFTNINWDPQYYNNIYKSYCYTASNRANHSITIVGWDDDFDKNNFNFTPHGNGAFIVKDSRGSSFGENGYYYVSYFDAIIGTDNACFTAENTDNYDNIYQYDYLGYVDKFGYNSESAYFSNIFNSVRDESLAAVSFYTLYPNCQFQIKVYTGLKEIPDDGILVGEKTGTIDLPGYHTIDLNKLISLKKGYKFSVVVGFKNVDSTQSIAIECPEYGYSSKAKANAGESFVSPDSESWQDITLQSPNTNVCLKAFTLNLNRNENSNSKPLMDKDNVKWNEDEKTVMIPYSTDIDFNSDNSDIKDKILIKVNNTQKYLPLGPGDKVEIGTQGDSNKLIIHFAEALDKSSIKLRVLGNTLINKYTGALQDTTEETPEYNIEKRLSMVSKNISIDEGRSIITIPYNTYIDWNIEKSKIRQNILISVDDSPFNILGEKDKAELNVLSNQIVINLAESIQGKNIKVKVLCNTLKNMLKDAEDEKAYVQKEDEETLWISLDRKQPHIDKNAVSIDATKKVISIPYSCEIQPTNTNMNGFNLKERVLLSQNGKDFFPLSNKDMVNIGSGKYSNCLIITLNNILVGDSLNIKVLPYTLKNAQTSDNQNQEENTGIIPFKDDYLQFASNSGNNAQSYLVSTEKEFKIKFNKPMDIDALNGNIIIVRNDTLQQEQLTYNVLKEDPNTILIKHENPFVKGINYTMYISRNIKTSKGGANLKRGIKFNFKVQN